MTTRFTLNVTSDNLDQSGKGLSQNATMSSDSPEDIIAALSQLAGVNRADNNYGAQEVDPNTGCGCDEGVEEEYSNSPDPEVYPAAGGVGDLVDTGHTARAKNHYTKSGFGDNPLAEENDNASGVLAKCASGELDCYDVMNSPKTPAEQEASKVLQQMYDDVAIDHHLHPDDDFEKILDIVADQLEQDYGAQPQGAVRNEELEESLSATLMRDWTEQKLQGISQDFDADAAIAAIFEGKEEFTQGSKQFVVRKDADVVKVFPLMENRTMMTMPLLVLDAASLVKEKVISNEASHQADTTMKHVKNPTQGEKDAAKDIKPGIAGYKDRIDMLKSAEKDGRLKEDNDSVDAVAGAITRRIMSQHLDVLSKYGPVKVMAAIDEVAEFAGSDGLDEIGSSDVSIWTKQVIQDLESGSFDHVGEELADEDMDQVDELSPGTLGSYIKKASGAEQPKNVMDPKNVPLTKIAAYQGDSETGYFGKRFNQSTYDKAERLRKNREQGISRAVDKLANEDLTDGTNEGDVVSTLGAIAASRYQPKEGDKIRTRKGGQIPGTVEKVGEVGGIEYCWFRHPEGKMYKTPCSNVMREDMDEAMEPWMGKDMDRPAADRKKEYEQGKEQGRGPEDRFRNPGSDTPAWKRKRPEPKTENIEMDEELQQIRALAGMHEAKVDEQDVDENAYVQAAAAAARSGAKEFEFPKGSGKMHPAKMDKGTAHQMDEAKPDFLDIDKDGDKEESMKDAAKDKEEKVDEDADFDYMLSLLNKWR